MGKSKPCQWRGLQNQIDVVGFTKNKQDKHLAYPVMTGPMRIQIPKGSSINGLVFGHKRLIAVDLYQVLGHPVARLAWPHASIALKHSY